MKRFTVSLIVSLVALLSIVTPASAFEQWQIKMSEPQATQQIRTFNIEYTILSVNADDQITVRLKQDGVVVGTQITTKQYGDSGAFTVTVPTDGTYTYLLEADSSAFEETKTTNPITVAVTSPSTTTVTVVRPTTQNAGTANTATGQTGGATAGANTGQGTVGEDGASTEYKEEDSDVLGAEDNKDSDSWSNVAIIVAVIVVLIAGYIFFYGGDKFTSLVKRILRR